MTKGYEELLAAFKSGNIDALSESEKTRLFRIREQPEVVRKIIIEKVAEGTAEVQKLWEELRRKDYMLDRLKDWLNGYEVENNDT